MTEETVASKTVEIQTTVTLPDGTVKYKCQYCGKWITKDDNIEQESGDYCRHLRENGLDTPELMGIRRDKTVTEVPSDEFGEFMKTANLHRVCVKNEIPVSAMVRAFGGDRGLSQPLHPKFQYVYVGRARYVSSWCGTAEGLNFLRSVARTPLGTVPLKDTPKTGKKSAKSTIKNAMAEAVTE